MVSKKIRKGSYLQVRKCLPHIVIMMSWRDRTVWRGGGEGEGEGRKRRVEEKTEEERRRGRRRGGDRGTVSSTVLPGLAFHTASHLNFRVKQCKVGNQDPGIHKLDQCRASLLPLLDKWPGTSSPGHLIKGCWIKMPQWDKVLAEHPPRRGLGYAASGQRCPNSIQLNFHLWKLPWRGLGAQGQNTGKLRELDRDKELIKTESKTRPLALPSCAADTRGLCDTHGPSGF